MKKESLILAMLSINTVFANTLPPTFDCDNSLPPCIERQIIESIRMKKLKMFEQRTYC